MNKMLVVGGRGVTGRAAVCHFESLDDWEVWGLSRSAPDFDTSAQWIAADVLDFEGTRDALSGLGGFTHVAFCTMTEQADMEQGWKDPTGVQTNLKMLTNSVTAIEDVSPNLRHISVMQGAKYYGKHLGPHRNPAKESDPRYMYPNFYYAQEDWLIKRSRDASWTWTAFRPQSVWTGDWGGTANFVIAAGVFAAISRELGIPLRYPGALNRIYEASDAELIAKAMAWSCTNPAAEGEAFNITNGDVFVMENLWPLLADTFDMPLAPPHTFPLAKVMSAHSDLWDSMVKKYDLVGQDYGSFMPNWQYMDFALGNSVKNEASLLSTIKLRKLGFTACLDSEERFVHLLKQAQAKRYLPY